MKEIAKIHSAIPAHMPDLVTFRALPLNEISELDPFLFLNHHGPQEYGPNNNGLPFGPHPHRGFETLTFVLEGDIVHRDTNKFKSKIHAGGVQWMTAGSGLIHSEISSEQFKKDGGSLEILQLWMNLPSELKMTAPDYYGFEKEQLVHISKNGSVIHLISGNYGSETGPMKSLTNLTMMFVDIPASSAFEIMIPEGHETLFYVVRGKLDIDGTSVGMHDLVEFKPGEGLIRASASEDAVVIVGHGIPFNEKIVAYGPFVMNSQQEIQQAFRDYESGKLGTWNE